VENNYGASPSDNHYQFTGYESDANESSTDYAIFRNLSYSMGRFNRPDPFGGSYEALDPQSLNRYTYVMNRPMAFVDPFGLNHQETVMIGNCIYTYDVGTTATSNPDGSIDMSVSGTLVSKFCGGDGGSGGGGGVGGGGGGAGAPSKTPCTQTKRYRVTQGVLGTANLGLAGVKTIGLLGADTLLAVATPFTGGTSAAVAVVGTVYGVTSIGGQAIAGTGQLYTAFGGNPAVGEQISQVGDILSGPLTGISTLVGTGGNMAQAQQAANLESTITAGAGLVNNKGFGEAVDLGLGLFGLSGAGCHP
jgi:RHS repeat-associated protein